MKIFDLIGLILYNLNRRKGRVVLTAIGVVIGTASVVILVSLANGLQRSATTQLGGISDLSAIEVMPRYEDMGPIMSSGAPPQVKQLTTGALEEIAAIPGVKQIIIREGLYGGGIVKYGRLENYPSILGVNVHDVSEMGFQMQAGSGQIIKGTALIGAPVMRNFYDPKLRPGQATPEPPDLLDQQIKLTIVKFNTDGTESRKTYVLKIAGIIKESRRESDYSLFVHMDDITAWNEWIMGKRINHNKEGYGYVTVRVNSVDEVLTVVDKIDQMGFAAYTPQDTVQSISNFYMMVQVIFGGVGAVALLVAAIGIANTMTMAILERTREIGLMKAIGATNRDVLSIFLGESAGIGFVGGLGGVGLGLLIGEAINIISLPSLAARAAEMGMPPPEAVVFTPLWLPLFAVIFATIIGLLSGLYPALRAATIVPVLALKYE